MKAVVATNGHGSLYAVLSPMMACEEAWLLGKAIRSIDPQAVLVLGPVPTTGEDEIFKNSVNGKQTFVIQAEKVPNAAGIRRVLEHARRADGDVRRLAGRQRAGSSQSSRAAGSSADIFRNWISTNCPTCSKRGFRVVQDILPNALSEVGRRGAARRRLGREGRLLGELSPARFRPSSAAVTPPEGARREGDVYYTIARPQRAV